MTAKRLELPIPLIKVVRKNHEGKRCYTIDGQDNFFPSVTTVLGCRGKKAIFAWRARVGEAEANKVSKQASGTGTAFHSLCEAYLDNDPDFNRKMMKAVPQASARFKKFVPVMENITGVYFQEQGVVSNTLGVGGTIDLFGEYKGRISIIDYKTSRRKKTLEDIPGYFAQCYAYAMAIKDMYGIEVQDAVILMSYEDSFEEFVMPIEYGKAYFMESLAMYNRGEYD